MTLRATTILFLFLSCLCRLVNASTDDIWTLSLEELVQIKVVTASKSSETLEQAPAVMSIVTAEEIRTFGANNLHDILRRVAGVNPASGAVLRDNLVSIRGQHSGTIDRRVLVLIDGRPYRDGHTGGVNENFYRTFPITSIERIEVIRGPASILYGSSATSGVINVVTRKGEHRDVMVLAGSFSTSALEYSASGKRNELEWRISGKNLNSDGWPYTSVDFSDSVETENLAHQDRSIQAAIQYHDISVSILSSEVDEEIFDSSLQFFWPSDRYKKRQDMLNIGYTSEIFSGWNMDLNFTYNAHDRKTNDGAVDVESKTSLLEATVDGNINKRLSLVSGMTYQLLDGNDFSNFLVPARWDQVWISGYYQLRYEPYKDVDLTFGQHYNRIDNETLPGGDMQFSDISSRIALGWKFAEPYKLKVLWSEAYRAPYGVELSFQSFLMGNPNLEPEKVDTKEMQLIYSHKKWLATFSYFRSVYDEEIVIVPRGVAPGFTFVNQGQLKVAGGEFEFAYDPVEKVRISGSYSLQENKSESVSAQRISEEMLKIGVGYKPRRGVNVGVFSSHFSRPPSAAVDNTAVTNPEAEAYTHVSFNASVDVGDWIGDETYEGVEISLYGDNILESDAVYQPDLTATGINAFPARSGRAWYVKARYQF